MAKSAAQTVINELAAQFHTIAGRKALIEQYGDSTEPFFGINEDGEDISLSIDSEEGIVLRTNQSNGWVRVNYYDSDGCACGESFDGRWR